MGILGKLAFWKKEDDFNFDNIANKDMGTDLFKGDNLGLKEQPLTQEKSPFEDNTNTASTAPSFGEPQKEPSAIEQMREQNQQARGATRTAPSVNARDIDLLSSKLDTIKALLNSMDQRMANLERSSGVQKKEKLW